MGTHPIFESDFDCLTDLNFRKSTMEDTLLTWQYDWIIIVGFIVAFLLAISVGANDVANPFGTSVGSGALSLLQCFVLATLMETLGAMTMGGAVSDMIWKKIVNIEIFNQTGN